MSETPKDLYYLASHEWVKMEDGVAIVGISDFAQSELGDVVFVELPESGSEVSANDQVSVVESVKTASDIYAPLSGEIVAINEDLEGTPELVNSNPYDGGWLFKIKISDESELSSLLNAEDYIESCEAN